MAGSAWRRLAGCRAFLAMTLVLSSVIVGITEAAPAAAQATSSAWTSPGYWLASSNGAVRAFGQAPDLGSAAALHLNRPVVGMAPTPSGRGYWLVASDGGIFSFGDARFFGSTGGIRLNQPVVGMAATPTGLGYWLVAADGGIFAFGDAGFAGSGVASHHQVVGMAATPSGRGYWMAASDGSVLSFGDAVFRGSPASGRGPGTPIVGLAPSPSGHGYWLAGANGAVFSYGDAAYHGSVGGAHLAGPVVGLAGSPDGGGYWLAAADGGVLTYGDAAFEGTAGRGVVAVATVRPRPPAQVAVFFYPWYANVATDGVVRHWDEGGHTPPQDIGSDYYPVRGAYSSSDAAVLHAQMSEIAAAGIDEIITSWWGQGSFEDQKLPLVVQAARAAGLKVAVHIEPYVGRSPAGVGQDIAHLNQTFGINQFFVYRAQDFTAGDWAPVLAPLSGMTVWAESFIDRLGTGDVQAFAKAARFDGVYTYDPFDPQGFDFPQICGAARVEHLLCSPSVAPGFSAVRATGGTAVRSRQNGATYDSMWQGAIESSPDLITITSYNEWHEGSQIEPASPSACLPTGFCYQTYDGAFGSTGQAASTAYLGRTALWSTLYRVFEAFG
jgi:hypothetical protein